MSEIQSNPEYSPINEAALEVGKQVVNAAAELLVSVVNNTDNEEIKHTLIDAFKDHLSDGGIELVPEQPVADVDNDQTRLGVTTNLTRDQLILKVNHYYWAKQHGFRPRLKKSR